MSRVVNVGLRLGLILAILLLGLGLLGRQWWLFDLFNHFRLPLFFGLALLFAIALLRRDRRMIGLSALLLGWTVVSLARLYLAEPAKAGGRALVVEVYNVNRAFGDPARVAGQLAQSDADVVGLIEVDAHWFDKLEPALRPWPHRLAHGRDDNFGLALYSKTPLVDAAVLDRARYAVIQARIEVDGAPVGVLLVHPPPPMAADWAAERDAAFEGYRAVLAEMPPESVVLGDFNATPWSRPFLAMLDANDLREARDVAGAGLRATWPAGMTAPRFLPIDHVLVRGALGVDVFEVLEENGSDHHPIRAVLRVGGR